MDVTAGTFLLDTRAGVACCILLAGPLSFVTTEGKCCLRLLFVRVMDTAKMSVPSRPGRDK